jgi:hypothetical protein
MDEEDLLLPRLQAVVDRGTLRRLGVAWEAVRHTAPTRTHPLVARRPPGNALAALPLSMIDRIRDALEHLSRRTGHRTRVLLSVSEHLGAIARRMERIGLLQRGERPETRADRR